MSQEQLDNAAGLECTYVGSVERRGAEAKTEGLGVDDVLQLLAVVRKSASDVPVEDRAELDQAVDDLGDDAARGRTRDRRGRPTCRRGTGSGAGSRAEGGNGRDHRCDDDGGRRCDAVNGAFH